MVKRLLAFCIALVLLCGCAARQSTGGEDPINPDDGLNNTPTVLTPLKPEKQANITAEQRETFFELARSEYWSALPAFENGARPELASFKWFSAALHPEEKTGDESPGMPNRVIEEDARRLFGAGYGLDPGGTTPLSIGSFREKMMAELIGYKKADDLVTVRLVSYDLGYLAYNDRQEEAPDYAADRQLIIHGTTDSLTAHNVYELCYRSADGVHPDKMVYCRIYYRAEQQYVPALPAWE